MVAMGDARVHPFSSAHFRCQPLPRVAVCVRCASQLMSYGTNNLEVQAHRVQALQPRERATRLVDVEVDAFTEEEVS